MLDIKFIRENPKLVEAGAAAKNIKININAVLKLDEEKRDLQTKSEEIRAEQKQLSAKIPKADKAEKEKLLTQTLGLKQEFVGLEEK